MKVKTCFKLHKVKKHWVTIASTATIALTGLIGSSAVLAEEQTALQTETQVQQVETPPSEENAPQADSGQAQTEQPVEQNTDQAAQNNEVTANEKATSDEQKLTEQETDAKEVDAKKDEQEADKPSEQSKKGFVTENGATYYYNDKGEKATGLQEIDGKGYYFDKDSGQMYVQKEATIDGKEYYFGMYGVQAKGAFVEMGSGEEVTYLYFDENGEKVKNRYVQITYKNFPATKYVKGAWVYLGADGKSLTGWQVIDGKKTYFSKPSASSTIHQARKTLWKIDGKEYYFDETGELVTNRKVIYKDKVYQTDENGVATLTNEVAPEEIPTDLKNTFYTSNKKFTYYFDANGQKVTGWQTIKDKEYFFDEDGRRLEGQFIKRDGKEYYLTKYDGEVARDRIAYLDSEKVLLAFDQEGQILKNQTINIYGTLYQTDEKGHASKIKAKNTFVTDYKGKKYYVNEKSELATGFYEIDGKKLYFLYGEQLKGGFFKVGWDTYYFDADGKPATGYQTIDGKKYYFAPDGKLLKGTGVDQDGKTISSNEETGEIVEKTEEQKKGFITENGATYYYNDKGEKVTGLQEIDGNTYYFDKDSGQMYVQKEATIDGKEYYFGMYGVQAKDAFVEMGHGEEVTYLYFDENGEKVKNRYVQITYKNFPATKYVKGAWVYLGADGKSLTGWQVIDGKKTYFSKPSGSSTIHQARKTLWKIDGKEYYFDETGELVTNRKVIYKDKVYQTDENGVATLINEVAPEKNADKTDENKGNDKEAIDKKDQWSKANSFHQGADGKWYYINDQGEQVKGWQTIDGKKMYFREDGSQVKGEFVFLNGKNYYFDQDSGEMWTNRFAGRRQYNSEHRDYYTDWYYLGADGAAVTGYQTIDGKEYYFYKGGAQAKGRAVRTEIGNYYNYYDSASGELVRNQFRKVYDSTFWTYNPRFNDLDAYMYFHADGRSAAGWETIDGKKMYFHIFPQTSIHAAVQVKGRLIEIEGKSYYFDPDSGELWTNRTLTYEGKNYQIDQNGVATLVQ